MNFDMTRSGPGKLLLRFALPLILPSIAQQLNTLVRQRDCGAAAGGECLRRLDSRGAVPVRLLWLHPSPKAGCSAQQRRISEVTP